MRKKYGILGIVIFFFFCTCTAYLPLSAEKDAWQPSGTCVEKPLHVKVAEWSNSVQTLIGLLQGLLQKIDAGFYVPVYSTPQKVSSAVREIISRLYKYRKKALAKIDIKKADVLAKETHRHICLLKKLIETNFADIDTFSLDKHGDSKNCEDAPISDKTDINLGRDLDDLKILIDQCGVTYVNRAARFVEDVAARIDDYTHISSWYLYAALLPATGIMLRHILPESIESALVKNYYGGNLPKWVFDVHWIGIPDIFIDRTEKKPFVGLGVVENYYERAIRIYLFFQLVRYFLDEKNKKLLDAIPEYIREKLGTWWSRLKGVTPQSTAESHSITLDDIDFEDEELIGLERQKKAVEDLIVYITDPQEYVTRGHVIRKNLMLIGPSGTGKTLFVRALAGEINKRFRLQSKRTEIALIELKYNDFDQQKASAFFTTLLKDLRARAPCILFIDGFHFYGSDASENAAFYTGLSTVMDALYGSGSPADQIFIIGTTTKPHLIPADLFSYKRFDKRIYFALPTAEQRRQFFTQALIKNLAIDPDKIDIEAYVRQTAGCGYGQLELVISSAKFKSNNIELQHEHIQQAIDEEVHRFVDENILSDAEKEAVAVHEAGHAFVACVEHPQASLEFATVRGQRSVLFDDAGVVRAGEPEYGVLVRYDPREGGARISVDEIKKNIRILLAGACAEKILLGDYMRNHHVHDKRQALELINAVLSDNGAAPVNESATRFFYDARERESCALIEKNNNTVRALADLLKKEQAVGVDEIAEQVQVDAC